VERGTRELAGLIGNLLSLAEVLFSVALIAQIVHAHPLVGTTAFWMTRPVVATTVMTSKFVVLGGAMIVMPVLVDAIVMGIYQVPWIDILGISAQTAMLWVMWIVAMMTLAALTPNLAKFALLLGGGLVTGPPRSRSFSLSPSIDSRRCLRCRQAAAKEKAPEGLHRSSQPSPPASLFSSCSTAHGCVSGLAPSASPE
jgi:hypothetical protein